MKIRALTRAERKYTYALQKSVLEMQTGFAGYLRGDFGSTGNKFFGEWINADTTEYKTKEFAVDFSEVINALRSGDYGLLKDFSSMGEFVKRYEESSFEGNCCTEYGFRVDTNNYAYLLRCNLTSKSDYNFYCHCYLKERLNKYIAEAEN